MNKRFTGQILRIVGLAIEMLGILAAALSGRQEIGRARLRGRALHFDRSASSWVRDSSSGWSVLS